LIGLTLEPPANPEYTLSQAMRRSE